MLSHKGAGAHARNHKTFAGKPVIHYGHCCTSHVQMPSQLSGRGQGFAWPKPSIEDRAAQLPIDFSTKIFAIEEVDVELHWLSVYPGTPKQLDWSI
jgi:hypothetical protein